jgi:methyltransferase family protein
VSVELETKSQKGVLAALRHRLRLHNYDIGVRYYPVAHFIRQQDPARRWRILDVGSGAVGLAQYLPGWRVVGIDRQVPCMGPRRSPVVAGLATALPFANDSWDAVSCIDVLEHIDPRWRLAVLDELLRVSRRWVLVAFPSGHEAREADVRARRAYRLSGLEPPAWLLEHLRHPFPEAEFLAERLRSTPRGRRIIEHWTSHNESLALQRIHRHLARKYVLGYKLCTVVCSLFLSVFGGPRVAKGSYRCLMVIGLSPGAQE